MKEFFKEKRLYALIVLVVLILWMISLIILGNISDGVISKWNSLNNSSEKTNTITPIVWNEGYTMVKLFPSDKEKKIAFNLIKESKCEELIKNIVSTKTIAFSFGYKSMKCEVFGEKVVSYQANILYTDENDQVKKELLKQSLYITNDGIVRTLPFNIVKAYKNDVLLLENGDKKWLYKITTEKNGWLLMIESYLSQYNNLDFEKVKVYEDTYTLDITIFEKDSLISHVFSYDYTKNSASHKQLYKTICSDIDICSDEIVGVFQDLQVKQNSFSGSITGHLVPSKVEKVIVTPDVSDECKIDTEPYELKKFQSGNGEFIYNFSLALKNICPKTGAKYTIDLIAEDGTKQNITSSVSWPFFTSDYTNIRYVPEARKGTDSWYGGYFLNAKNHKDYVHLTQCGPGGCYYTTSENETLDLSTIEGAVDNTNGADEFYYLKSDSSHTRYLDNSLIIYYRSYLKEGISETINDQISLSFKDELDVFSFEKYNGEYKKVGDLVYDNLYLKDNRFYVKGKNDIMLPVELNVKDGFQYKLANAAKNQANELFLKSKSQIIVSLKNNNFVKIGTIDNRLNVYNDKSTGCLYVALKWYTDYGLIYDYFSENTKLNFKDGKDYGDYTFRQAGQVYEIRDFNANNCYSLVSEEDIKPTERLTEYGDYVGFPIYKFKDDNDVYLKRRFREQYGLERGQEQGERYDEFIKTLPVLYWKDPFSRWMRVVNMIYVPQAEKAKPVIYLYPTKTEKINVQVTPNGWFKTTIPEYPRGGWDVIATPDSFITFEQKNYPYLFWEGLALGYQMNQKGFVIKNEKSEIEKFLQEKLSKLGLIQKEINDFDEFWIPKLSQVPHPYIFITFSSKADQDKDSPLQVTPTPDSIIRVFMDYKGMDQARKVEELPIVTPVRNWFSVVEWGGAKRW